MSHRATKHKKRKARFKQIDCDVYKLYNLKKKSLKSELKRSSAAAVSSGDYRKVLITESVFDSER